MRRQFCDAMVARAAKPDMVFLSGDLGFMALEPLQQALGERFVNAGVAEQNMMSIAAAMSRLSLETWAYSIAPFCYARPFEQIRNDITLHDLPVKMVGKEIWSTVIPSNSFNVIVNPESMLYTNYKLDQKLEEVICNLYSVWYTEPNIDQTPLNEQPIKALMEAIKARVLAATERLLKPKEISVSAPSDLSTARYTDEESLHLGRS